MTWLSTAGIGSIRAAICPRMAAVLRRWGEEVGAPLMDFSNPIRHAKVRRGGYGRVFL